MSLQVNRRELGKLLGVSAVAASLPVVASAAVLEGKGGERSFPAGFVWGSATASYQVEGAVKEGGRGPSIWDTFSHTAGKTHNGDNGDVADDFYHRYREDIGLMKGLGLKGCRFSVSWTRIFPGGVGPANQEGVDFYKRMVDTLLEHGIEPYCTLFHWDLPQALQDKGGWENKDTAKAYADYAGYFARQMGDRIKHYMTMNEMRTFVEVGYGSGRHAPGLSVGQKRLAQLNHYVVLAHGLGVQALRSATKKGTSIGLAENASAIVPVIDMPEHVAAARKAMRESNASYLSVILDGKYSELYLKHLGANAPVFTADELKTISSPVDFVGLNVYGPQYVRAADNERGYENVPWPTSFPHMPSPWLHVGPESLYWTPKLVNDLWKPKELYITENGCSADDTLAADGHVYDIDRVMFLRNYLTQLQRAVAEGFPVKGYFLWSLLDNFEWADGYERRFGITYVDFKTLKRTVKLSGEFYREVIKQNAIA